MSQLLSPQAPSQRRPRPYVRYIAAALALCATAADAGPPRPEVVWAERQIVFWAEADTGAVHAVGIRQGVSEFGVLRAPQRRGVSQLSLDARNAVLTVWGDDAIYRYDAHNLRLLSRNETRIARATTQPHRWVE